MLSHYLTHATIKVIDHYCSKYKMGAEKKWTRGSFSNFNPISTFLGGRSRKCTDNS